MENRTSNKLVFTVFLLFQINAFQVVASDVFKGREVYMRECMACHGASGEGKLPGLVNFKEDQTLFKTDSTLVNIVRDGKGVMPGFNGLLDEEDIHNVVAYLRTFL
jgi:cytochrome c6